MSSLPEFLTQNGVLLTDSSHSRVTNGWIGFDCPRCQLSAGCGIELRTGRTNCWVCGIQNGPKIVAEITGQKLGDVLGVWKNLFQDTHLAKRLDPVKRGKLVLPKGIGELLPVHRHYLERRGFDPDELARIWGLQGIGMAVDLAWTLFIPICSRSGEVVSWTSRTLADEGQRYHSAKPEQELVSLKSILYGGHLARNVAIVVEGPADAWAIGPGAVATLGLACTQAQLGALSTYAVRVLCYDSTEQAQIRADAVARALAPCAGRTIRIELETGDDPGSASKAELLELRKQFLCG